VSSACHSETSSYSTTRHDTTWRKSNRQNKRHGKTRLKSRERHRPCMNSNSLLTTVFKKRQWARKKRGYWPTTYMMFDAMIALLSLPRFCSHSPNSSCTAHQLTDQLHSTLHIVYLGTRLGLRISMHIFLKAGYITLENYSSPPKYK